MSAIRRFLVRHWFAVLGGIYGLASVVVGVGIEDASYWIGLAFGLAAYIGCAVEDWL